jgi:hypothetical protein
MAGVLLRRKKHEPEKSLGEQPFNVNISNTCLRKTQDAAKVCAAIHLCGFIKPLPQRNIAVALLGHVLHSPIRLIRVEE